MDNPIQKPNFSQIALLSSIITLFVLNGLILYFSITRNLSIISYISASTNVVFLILLIFIRQVWAKHHLTEKQRKLLESQLNGTIQSSKEFREMLTFEMQELSIQNEKMALLIELSEMLQACNSFEEAFKVIEDKCRKILHFADGTLYIATNQNHFLEIAVSWGMPVSQMAAITPDECWALRRGGLYHVKHPNIDLICNHILAKDDLNPYLCAPLLAQNSLIGMLHLDLASDGKALSFENRILITAVTETLALALANIQLRESLRNQSIHDSLTGLYNKRFLSEFFPKAINLAWRNKDNLGVLMMDIDFFKQFNDTYGHEAGDLLLAEIGKFFQNEMRSSDIICRFGGEEFLCVLHHCQLDNAKIRAEEIREKAGNVSILLRDRTINPISLSIGVAVYPDDGQTMAELIEAADKALYQAKKSGRNSVVAFSEMKNH